MVAKPSRPAHDRASARALLTAMVLLCLGLTSCAPAAPSPSTAAAPEVSRSRGLRIGMYEGEPQAGIALLGSGAVFVRAGIGAPEHTYTYHAGLTVFDARGDLTPRIAQKVPSLEDGDWKLFPDGQMEVTWKLRTDVRWHDGFAMSAADFVFGTEIIQDRDLPLRRGEPVSLISEVLAPDPHTLVVRWKGLYPEADASGPTDIPAVPAHLLADLYRAGDKQAFANARYWTSEFVGLGPYRLGEWVLGAYLEALAFDGYFLGRPKIDRIVFSYYSDPSVLYTSHLAGEVDMTPFGSFQSLHFIPFKKEWEPTGAGTALAVFSGTRNYRFQFRYPDAPWADRRVRQALVHMLDRQDLADGLLGGLSSGADTMVAPDTPCTSSSSSAGCQNTPSTWPRRNA